MIRGHRLAAGADHRLAHVSPDFTLSWRASRAARPLPRRMLPPACQAGVQSSVLRRHRPGRSMLRPARALLRIVRVVHRLGLTVEASCDLATADADAPMTGFSDVILREDLGVPLLSNFSCFRTL